MAPPIPFPTSCICRPRHRLLAHNLSSSSTSSSALLLRAFTTTPSRRKHGAVPSFTPTSSPPLNTLLTSLRTKVFLPSHLITPQRHLLYRRKHRDLLLNPDEPATVKLGSEIHTLRPLSHTDEPGTQQSVDTALKLMGEIREWGNLVPLFEGLKGARRKVRGRWVERGVRCAVVGGGDAYVMEGLKRVEETGMSLWVCEGRGVAREVFWGAVVKRLGKGDVEGARRWADGLWELCWDERHVVEEGKGGRDPRRMPDFLAGLMLVHALEGGDVGKVERFAREVVRWWEGRRCQVPTVEEWGKQKIVEGEANGMLMMWCPALAGMRVGRKVLGEGSELGKRMGKMIKEVEPVVEECLAIVKGQEGEVRTQRRGLAMFEEMAKIE